MSETKKQPLTKEERAAISRANGSCSKGPVTAAGKLRASRNALTNACTARVHSLLTDDPARVQARLDLWHAFYNPASPAGFHELGECVNASFRIEHVNAATSSIVNEQL